MSDLTSCKTWINEIDWDLIHEDAVTTYLEWGNNDFKSALRPPSTSGQDYSIYFVVDTWAEPKVSLMKMNNYGSQVLCEKKLPEDLAAAYLKAIGNVRGIHELTPELKDWIKAEFEKKE